jgi:hypothetical protein
MKLMAKVEPTTGVQGMMAEDIFYDEEVEMLKQQKSPVEG